MKKWDMRQMKDGNSELRYLALTLECVTIKFLCSHFLLTYQTAAVPVSHCYRDRAGARMDRTGKRKRPGQWGGWPLLRPQRLAAFRIHKDYLFRGELRIEMGLSLVAQSVVKNPPENTGDRGSIPGLGRCRMQLNWCTTTAEPAL